MISLVVYGRNDQHGYNAHRRVALSLNAMAEVLTAPGDEILFVDYNTPAGMPTLPEAISDTLTDRALDVIRVLRVTAAMHEAAVGDRSKHPINEPLARNTAIRRARPGNWILSTNTDMVFVPRGGTSLSEVVSQLDGDAYCLPRFEIPEWLWESVPRTDPRAMINLLGEWGERAGLDEVTLGHDWILYDAPGDFQLLRRSLIEEIHGFDEEMVHGWHVDSNLWRRVHNRLGSIGTLYPEVAGYHANHNRTLTRWMKSGSSGNDLTRFVYGAQHSGLPAQANTWGLAGEDVPEIVLARPDARSRLAAASVRIPGQDRPLITSDTREQQAAVAYDARHALPFLLDPILSTTPRPTVTYVGINDSTRQMLQAALDLLSPPSALLPAEDLDSADLVVLDLGIDVSTGRGPIRRYEAVRLTSEADDAVRVLRDHPSPPAVLLINGASGLWTEWVACTFQVLYGTFHTRVQAAVVRDSPEALPAPAEMARPLLFVARTTSIAAPVAEPTKVTTIDLSRNESIDGLISGWSGVDRDGAFVGTANARLHFADPIPAPPGRHVVVDLTVWKPTGGAAADELHVRMALDAEVLLAEALAPADRQNALHTTTQVTGGQEHDLEIQVMTRSGDAYDPVSHGGTQPWLRIDRLRLVRADAAGTQRSNTGLIAVGRNLPGELFLRGWWGRSDVDGVWALAGRGEIAVPSHVAQDAVKLELLGHPERQGQALQIVARGDGEVRTNVDDLPTDRPEAVMALLPAPGADGVVTLAFHPIDSAAPKGELVQIRGIGEAVRSYQAGDTLLLTRGSQDLSALSNGWHVPEDTGTWTSDENAVLALRTTDGLPRGAKLYVQGGSLDPHRQELSVTVNGEVARVRRRRGGRFVVHLPRAVSSNEILALGFHTSPLLAPGAGEDSDDPRMLGSVVNAISLGKPRERIGDTD